MKSSKKPFWQRVIDPQAISIVKFIHSLDHGLIPCVLARNILEALRPFINIVCSALILDQLILKTPAEQMMQIVFWMVGFNFVCSMLVALLDWVEKGPKELFLLDAEAFAKKALQLDYQEMEQTRVQDLVRMYEEVNNMGGLNLLLGPLGNSVKGLVSVVYATVMVAPLFVTPLIRGKGELVWLFSSPLVSVLMLALLAFSIFASLKSVKQKEQLIKEDFEQSMKYNRRARYFYYQSTNYQTGKDIRSHHLSDLFLEQLEKWSDGVMYFIRSQTNAEKKYGGRVILVSQLAAVVFYLLVGVKALLGVISVGSVLMYVSALVNFQQSFVALLVDLSNLNIYAKKMECYTEFYALKNHKYEGTLPVEKRNDNDYELEFRDVCFSYPGSDRLILDHLSFKLKVGDKLALVGLNGAGKTTFVKLLCRLYDPTAGEILLNGIDIKKYDYQEYQSLFSVVFQDFHLFSFELGQNVAASTRYENEKVWDCLEKAGVEQRVQAMPKGLRTVLYQSGESGVEISGGEAQKIAIARALYKDAPFVILDEPTSALDPISEYEIYSRFDSLVSDKTSVYISHRMSSCRFCNTIAVFEKGGICEIGSHEQLMAKQGRYYQMWQAQAKYYQEEQEMQERFGQQVFA